jgi:hypothetical protein
MVDPIYSLHMTKQPKNLILLRFHRKESEQLSRTTILLRFHRKESEQLSRTIILLIGQLTGQCSSLKQYPGNGAK